MMLFVMLPSMAFRPGKGPSLWMCSPARLHRSSVTMGVSAPLSAMTLSSRMSAPVEVVNTNPVAHVVPVMRSRLCRTCLVLLRSTNLGSNRYCSFCSYMGTPAALVLLLTAAAAAAVGSLNTCFSLLVIELRWSWAKLIIWS